MSIARTSDKEPSPPKTSSRLLPALRDNMRLCRHASRGSLGRVRSRRVAPFLGAHNPCYRKRRAFIPSKACTTFPPETLSRRRHPHGRTGSSTPTHPSGENSTSAGKRKRRSLIRSGGNPWPEGRFNRCPRRGNFSSPLNDIPLMKHPVRSSAMDMWTARFRGVPIRAAGARPAHMPTALLLCARWIIISRRGSRFMEGHSPAAG